MLVRPPTPQGATMDYALSPVGSRALQLSRVFTHGCLLVTCAFIVHHARCEASGTLTATIASTGTAEASLCSGDQYSLPTPLFHLLSSDSVIGCGGIQLKLPAAAGAVPMGALGPEKQTPGAPGPGAPWVPRAVNPTGRGLQLELQQWVELEASHTAGLQGGGDRERLRGSPACGTRYSDNPTRQLPVGLSL